MGTVWLCLDKNLHNKSRKMRINTQIIFTCSKSTIEIPEKGVKCAQSSQQKHKSTVNNFEYISHFFQMFLLFTLNK